MLLMVAFEGSEDAQVTVLVRFAVEASLYVPVAVYCCVVPLVMVVEAGVTAIDCSVALPAAPT